MQDPNATANQAALALVDNAPLGVYVVDAELRLRAVSHRAAPLFKGIEPLLGRDMREVSRIVWAETTAAEEIGRLEHTIATGDPYIAERHLRTRENGERSDCYGREIHRLRLPDGQFGAVCYFQDATTLEQEDRILARVAQRDAFVLELNERLRLLSDPQQIMAAAAEVLARKLGAASTGYVEVADDGDTMTIGGEFRDGRLPDNRGGYRLSDFGTGFGPTLRGGDDVLSEDIPTDPRGPAGGSPLTRALGVRAAAGTPLLKQGRLVAALYAMHDHAHEWTELEHALIRETAERTWSAVERARTREELRRKTAELETLINRAPLGVYLVDADFRLQQVNPAARPAFGDLTGLVGRDFSEVMHLISENGYANEIVRLFRHTLNTGIPYAAHEWLTHRRGGADEYYEWRIDRIPLPSGRYGVVCYFRRVSESVRARAAIAASEAALRASQERHAFLLALSDTVRPLIDPRQVQTETARALGKHLGVNCVLYGEVETTEDGDYYVVGPEYRVRGAPDRTKPRYRTDAYGASLAKELRAGRTVIVSDIGREPRLTAAERATYAATSVKAQVAVPLIKNGRHAAFIAVQNNAPRTWTADDIALIEDAAERTWGAVERARAESRLHESQARLQLALDASDMGTFVWHMAEDRGEPDKRSLALFGLPSDGHINGPVFNELIHPDDRERMSEAMQRATDPNGSGTLREDFRVVHRDGTLHWLSITARVMFEGSPPRPVRMVGMQFDISARKQTEETLRHSEELLKGSDRRKDEFLAMLAHELRNPLAPIRTGLEMLRVVADQPEAIDRVRVMMERQVGHMVRLVDDLLDVSRITSGKIRLRHHPTLLATLVDTAVEANREGLSAGEVDLSVEVPKAPLVLDVDPTRFVQIVSNLLHNAVKFTGPGGKVAVSARVNATASGSGRELALTVSDSGVGIDREVLPRVFDLFVQGGEETAQSGLGIGLALARRLVEMHGGSIEATSAGHGRGSAFTIRMPLQAGVPAATVQDQVARPAREKPQQHHVVVIDDNTDAADMTAMFISALGAESKVAYDGESGLSLIDSFHPDVVLLDIGMPGIDGYETCRRIRQRVGKDVYVIAMTGWGQERDKQEAKRAGFDEHLTKPVDPAALKDVLAHAGVVTAARHAG